MNQLKGKETIERCNDKTNNVFELRNVEQEAQIAESDIEKVLVLVLVYLLGLLGKCRKA